MQSLHDETWHVGNEYSCIHQLILCHGISVTLSRDSVLTLCFLSSVSPGTRINKEGVTVGLSLFFFSCCVYSLSFPGLSVRQLLCLCWYWDRDREVTTTNDRECRCVTVSDSLFLFLGIRNLFEPLQWKWGTTFDLSVPHATSEHVSLRQEEQSSVPYSTHILRVVVYVDPLKGPLQPVLCF